jgi:hypothetical protein
VPSSAADPVGADTAGDPPPEHPAAPGSPR